MRHALALVLALGLVLGGALAAHAGPPDEPIGDGKLGRVRLGWEGHAPAAGLFPVTLLLANPDPVAHALRATVTALGETQEAQVTLEPGARRRLVFVVPSSPGSSVAIGLSEDGKVLASSSHSAAVLPPVSVLLVDGEPGSRTIADVVSGSVVSTCAPDEVGGELACLAPFEAIVLRRTNPARAGEAVRGALEDYVRAGGTLVVAASPSDPETRTFWEETKGPVGARGRLQEKRHGLGRVLFTLEDPCAATPEGLALRQALAAELDLVPRRLFPRFFADDCSNEAAHRAAKLLGGFFLLYLVLTGPVLARGYRGARPRRVLRFLAILVPAFCGLAVLMASSLRHQASRVDALTFVVVPREGEALAVSEVIVASGGSAKEAIVLEGEDIAATVAERTRPFGATDPRVMLGPLWTPSSVLTKRALGAHPVVFEELKVPTLGDVRVMALAGARDYRPLDASIEINPATHDRVARVHNTSGHDLGAIAVYETGRPGDLFVARLLGGLKAGDTATAPLTTRTYALAAHLVGFPSELEPYGMENLAPREPDGTNPRYVLLAQEELPLHVRASNAAVHEHAWRVETVAAAATSTVLPGYVGLKVKPAPPGVRVVESNLQKAERRLRGGMPSVGNMILAVGGVPVRSQADLDRAFSRVEAEGRVEIVTDSMRYFVYVSGPVTPKRRRASVLQPIGGDEEE